MPLSCFSNSLQWGQFASLLTVTISPVVVYVVAFVLLRMWQLHRSITQGQIHRMNKKQLRRVNTLFVRALLLFYPGISREICKCFRCDDYDGGDAGSLRLLKADLYDKTEPLLLAP